MAADPITLLGAGGHGWVVAEAARAAGMRVSAVYDDDPEAISPVAAVAGPLEAFFGRPAPWILAIGDLERRRVLLGRLEKLDVPAAAVVHPRAVVSPSAVVGVGVFVSAGVVINARAHLGAHAIINTGAIVEHDCRVGSGAHVAPGAVLGGGVVVGDDALVGLGARVRPGTLIGPGATVAMGAVVLTDVAPGTTVRGVPARVAPAGA